ncbi:WD40 repeat-like protein [Gymnopilus junonius]|uniref:WD40 repeat-like protein n=1 Tax=Gymnopilus junonius TaxID=109634 RepID=A0A9P5P1Z3_GYMJU|nr:WD40 repeat-like protein [Gymnopilus junonius]
MRLSDSDHDGPSSGTPDLSVQAGPSSLNGSSDGLIGTNGHTNGFAPVTNGNSGMGAAIGNGVAKHGKSIAKVTLPGTALYDDSFVDREEFVRLVIQSLRDVGYVESAATLEAESGYTMESPEVSLFRQYILDGMWAKAEAALGRLGVQDKEGLWDAKFLISRQKYLELLEARKPTAALQVLRNELAPLNVDPDQLHTLSSLIMCAEPEDLRRRAGWDGAFGESRRQLLDILHDYIPSAIMIPQRRFSTLLQQAKAYQRQRCIYHNSTLNSSNFSLYSDHRCNKADFPKITTTILDMHTDEVWNIEWSHDGTYLASASKDKSAIIWRRGPSTDPSASPYDQWAPHLTLREHPYPVGCLCWSLDDAILLTSTEQYLKMWNTKTGVLIRTLDEHTETVTAISWLPDGTGFISGGLDRKIIIWDADGNVRDSWSPTGIRITDLSVTPDFTRLVAVGMEHSSSFPSVPESNQVRGAQPDTSATGGNGPSSSVGSRVAHRMMVFDLATKQTELSIRLEADLTSVQTSQDSRYALINHAPNEIQLRDLNTGQIACRYEGQTQGRHVIRSCFGGIDSNFVVSGSEDSNVYVWHRESGILLEVLSGHGEGSVNSVAWNPTNERMFASCSDDRSIRIWEAPPPGAYTVERLSPEPSKLAPSSTVEKGEEKTRQRTDTNGALRNASFGSTRL